MCPWRTRTYHQSKFRKRNRHKSKSWSPTVTSRKTFFKTFFIFLHILHNLQIWAYILLYRIIPLFCPFRYSSYLFCTSIGIVPTALYTIKFFANFEFVVFNTNCKAIKLKRPSLCALRVTWWKRRLQVQTSLDRPLI